MRVSVIGKELEAGVAVDALCARTGHGVAERVRGDLARAGITERAVNRDWIGRRRVLRLQAVAGLAQMCTLGADVPDFQNPLLAERTLQREVPLLRVRHHVMTRNL